jgi:predicted MFS family arabinose efflux permease/DNA-binding MarR family transcriptional regulator
VIRVSATARVGGTEFEQRNAHGIFVVFGGLMLVLLMAALDQTIVATALPTIVGDLGGLNQISWVVTAYLLAQTAVTPLYGKLGDLYGRKIVLQAALVLFLIGSALCGLSQNMTELILFRGLQGLGGGGLIVGTMAAIGDVVTPRERGRYQGVFGAVFGLASVIGPLLGGLFAAAVVLIGAFVFVERRAAEPILPLRLFHDSVFRVTSAIGLVVGFALFGSITYLPLFLQVVGGATPTGSGLQLLPLMAGLLLTSIGSGQIISRTGHYRPFPIAGTAIMSAGLILLSTLNAHTSHLESSAFMFILGLGLGCVMQVLVLAVQNAVDYRDLGVATSGATLFRSIGGSVGTAVLGSIFSNRLKAELSSVLPRSAGGSLASVSHLSTTAIKKLPPALHTGYLQAFTNALTTVFAVAAGVATVAFVLSWLLQERPLRGTATASTGVGETFAVPKHTDSLAEASRALSVLVGRDGRRQLVARLAERAGVDLSPAACWLIVRLHEDPHADIAELCGSYDIPLEVGERARGELVDRGLVTRDGDEITGLTPQGHAIAERLTAERRASMERLMEGWSASENPDLAGLLTRLAREVGREPPRELTAAGTTSGAQ